MLLSVNEHPIGSTGKVSTKITYNMLVSRSDSGTFSLNEIL